MAIYRHILCATDFSDGSDKACARAVSLSNALDARLTFLHVVENFPEQHPSEFIPAENEDPKHFREEDARRKMADQVQRLECTGVAQEVLFTTESAWHEVVDFTRENQVDLIVMAEPEQHGVNRILSSTAEKVVSHRPCDVLIVPVSSGR